MRHPSKMKGVSYLRRSFFWLYPERGKDHPLFGVSTDSLLHVFYDRRLNNIRLLAFFGRKRQSHGSKDATDAPLRIAPAESANQRSPCTNGEMHWTNRQACRSAEKVPHHTFAFDCAIGCNQHHL